MQLKTIIGIMAGFLTTISFLPQAIKVWKSKSAKDLSLIMYSFFSIGVFLWMLYGIMLNELPIIIPNFFALILALFILSIKIIYK
ncbi:MAG: SemiSWEET transporter [Candidatus Margulisbacteria bacterium]|nr:SemiSWEET transporter [Candidatus Margulisiibacteriota bacterium]